MRLGTLKRMVIMAAAVTIGVSTAAAEAPPAKADGQAVFAADLYHQLIGGDKAAAPGNVFFSPYSVRTAISMLGIGADHETADQIFKAIHLQKDELLKLLPFAAIEADRPQPVQPLGHVRSRDDDTPQFQLDVVNALWGQIGYPFKPAFKAELKARFGADFTPVDFVKDPESVRGLVNKWANDKTHGKIEQVLPSGSVDESTRLVLADAVYFKARWDKEFVKSETNPMPFRLTDEKSADVSMMHCYPEPEGFLQADQVTVVKKSYKYDSHGSAEFVLVLPNDANGLPAVEQKITGEMIARWTGDLPLEKVELRMPKFKFKAEKELSDACRGMGMVNAFDSAKADFSKLADPAPGKPLYVSGVFHSAFVAVDEEGTEAAAVTAVAMRAALAMQSKPPVIHQVVADRPFLFMVVDRDTKTVLFMGRVTDPR